MTAAADAPLDPWFAWTVFCVAMFAVFVWLAFAPTKADRERRRRADRRRLLRELDAHRNDTEGWGRR